MKAKVKKENPVQERRRHARFPVMQGMVEPITIAFGVPKNGKKPAAGGTAASDGQPALLTNLSAGGLSIITFLEPPRAKKLEMVLSIPGFNQVPIEGKVVRILEKGQTYNVGIAFVKISKKHQAQIDSMAQDHTDCETRIELKLPEVCVATCTFFALCTKPHKGPYWQKK